MKQNIRMVQVIDITHKSGEKSSFKKESSDLVLSVMFDSDWVNIEYSSQNRQIRGILISKDDIESISYIEDIT
jgi:hypothetical protein